MKYQCITVIIVITLIFSGIFLKNAECADCIVDCIEDESGQINIVDTITLGENQVSAMVEVKLVPNKVQSLGFEVTFSSDCLNYIGYEPGELMNEFTQFGCNNVSPGLIRCGGLDTGSGIDILQSGNIVELKFTATTLELDDPNEAIKLTIQKQVDDIADWSNSPGYICSGNCNCDVNDSDEVTPGDALCAFQKYMGICPTACGNCGDVCCDINKDEDCSPSDALEIFKNYLGLESICSE